MHCNDAYRGNDSCAIQEKSHSYSTRMGQNLLAVSIKPILLFVVFAFESVANGVHYRTVLESHRNHAPISLRFALGVGS